LLHALHDASITIPRRGGIRHFPLAAARSDKIIKKKKREKRKEKGKRNARSLELESLNARRTEKEGAQRESIVDQTGREA
jgi:hypothetical protein